VTGLFSPAVLREEVKSTCERYGLDPEYFSAHSPLKGGITHMGSLRSSAEHMARGNYAPNSRVMCQKYDQSVGLGLLGASSLQARRKPTVKDVKRPLPARRQPL
jgi:hypothetical protein